MTPSLPGAAPVAVDPRVRTQIVVAVLLGLFLAALDQTVVGTALPRIVTDLRGNDIYTWAFTAYLLTATISGPIYGKVSDLFGRRPVLLFAVAVFLVGSLLAGLSQEMWQFVGFRAIQGLGAGALFPIALAVIGDMFDATERGKYQGLVGAIFGLSSVIGPAIGGVITDTIGWHWVFFVNLPIGVIVFAVIWRSLPRVRPSAGRPQIDYLGASVLIAALVPILVGLTNKQSGEWTDPAVGGLIAVGLAISALFVWIESRASEPIVPLGLFRIRSFTLSVIAMFVASMAFFVPIVFLPRWFQVVGGASATQSGYQILALLGGLIFSAMASGQIVARTGRYKVLALGASVLLGLGLFLLTNLRADTPLPVLWAWMFITGLGVGPMFAIFTLVVQGAVAPRQIGTATSSLTLFQQVGGSVGLAISGTVFGARLAEELPRQLSSLPSQITGAFAGRATGQLSGVGDLGQSILAAAPAEARAQIAPFVPEIVAAIHRAFSIATASTFTFGIAAAVVVLVAVALLREAPARVEAVEDETLAACHDRNARDPLGAVRCHDDRIGDVSAAVAGAPEPGLEDQRHARLERRLVPELEGRRLIEPAADPVPRVSGRTRAIAPLLKAASLERIGTRTRHRVRGDARSDRIEHRGGHQGRRVHDRAELARRFAHDRHPSDVHVVVVVQRAADDVDLLTLAQGLIGREADAGLDELAAEDEHRERQALRAREHNGPLHVAGDRALVRAGSNAGQERDETRVGHARGLADDVELGWALDLRDRRQEGARVDQLALRASGFYGVRERRRKEQQPRDADTPRRSRHGLGDATRQRRDVRLDDDILEPGLLRRAIPVRVGEEPRRGAR
jgi:EmrB/QacA subfamily drug resistance transporter